MTEVPAAFGAEHLGACHEMAVIDLGLGRAFERLVEARPAAMGVEFGVGFEKRAPASGAKIGALAHLRVQRARSRLLGAVLAKHAVLLRRQGPAPLFIALGDRKILLGHGRALQFAASAIAALSVSLNLPLLPKSQVAP